MANEYSASNIQVLKGLEAVRKRPAMYIGGTDKDGLHHMVWEIVDNGIDEALAGFADTVTVILNQDGSVTVKDNGRGIPVDIHPIEKVSALQLASTTLHAGGKFDSDTYKVSSGLHGVGLSVVNALSEWTKIEIHKDGKKYMQEYKIGIPDYDVKEIGKSDLQGSYITFKPDATIFSTTEFIYKTIQNRIRQHAYLNGGVKFELIDERNDDKKYFAFFFEGGLKSYVKHINLHLNPIHKNVFHIRGNEDDIDIEVSIQYTDDLQTREYAFANNILNNEGGTHLSGLRSSLTRAINSYIAEFGNEKEKNVKLTGDDVREGLTAAISVKVGDPQFEGQTKIKLNNKEVSGAVRKVLEPKIRTFLTENPADAKNIIQRVVLASKARNAAKAARDSVLRKSVFESGGLPGKLADCSSKDPTMSELYIVEGDSAGGSAKQARDRDTQAILPVFGKPMNAEKYRMDRVLEHKMGDLVKVLGCGIGETFDISKLRYHKVILMADADVDGAHINALNLTFFFRYFRQIIDNGFLYISQPPLYKVTYGPNDVTWVQDDEELQSFLKTKSDTKQPSIQRFKGLGEMNAQQLYETTMSKASRTLKKVTIDDYELADKTFDILMGAEVPPRKKYIQAYSNEAEIDV
ncbi:MAG: DNA gyrase subunit B [Candidatus Dojkabacteria bacterium]|nr:DNA gyrase subunit B [Candidatus Dojkabacteria bacterium]MDQ7020467.1 DNA gyrase subunit B [Candidatus Dojkabacteria bacterium]